MKRECKFRAQRIDTCEWVYGHYTQGTENNHYITRPDGAVWEINPETVGQFTGLKDKNGVEIYEGDIVRASMPCDYEDIKIYFVGFDNGAFVFYRSLEDKWPARQWKDGTNDWNSIENVEFYLSEVIGNVFNNPDLLI